MLRRRNYFIKKKFQVGFFYRFLILLVLEAALIVGLFMYISTDTLTTGYSNSTLTIKSTPSFFLIPFLLIILIVCVGIGIAAMIIFILLSHRIAGPLYRFEKILNEISTGDLTKRISLRKTDQLTELKEALNILMESFDQRLGRVKNNLFELRELLAKNDPANSEKIYKAIELLKDEIDHFKVTSGSKE
ncbi:MAG: methyl-accepting chemotaxis protein [Candidatus Omnitrophota bacterium]|nr:methyl-accepting chemotaxis protein [Candidatus Omnitrophota bacterium]